jgi:hypothetical protein
VDLVAISEGLIGDPLLIGLFLVDHLWFMETAGNKKTPQPGGSSRGLRVTVRYQRRLMCHALGKDDDGAGGNEGHAFSFPSGEIRVNEPLPDLTMWTPLSTF